VFDFIDHWLGDFLAVQNMIEDNQDMTTLNLAIYTMSLSN